jgi:hypothetical protein
MHDNPTPPPGLLRLALASGIGAGALSGLAMAWRGRVDNGHVCSGMNPPSHWLWGDSGIDADGASWRYTAVGLGVHQASAFFWSTVFGFLRRRRHRPTATNAVSDAAAVTAAAAWVDLRGMPHRLTPGFQERLSTRSLGWVYGGFAVGLAIAGLMALKGPETQRRDRSSL